MENKVVPEGNGPVPQQEEFGSDEPTLADLYRLFQERFDRWDKKLDKISEDRRSMNQRLTRLAHGARQPHLAMEADGPANPKTRERTESAATAVQAKHGDSCSTDRVNPDPKTNSNSFSVKAEPSALPCRDDVLVENGATAPKSCLPSLSVSTIPPPNRRLHEPENKVNSPLQVAK